MSSERSKIWKKHESYNHVFCCQSRSAWRAPFLRSIDKELKKWLTAAAIRQDIMTGRTKSLPRRRETPVRRECPQARSKVPRLQLDSYCHHAGCRRTGKNGSIRFKYCILFSSTVCFIVVKYSPLSSFSSVPLLHVWPLTRLTVSYITKI
jgi:hypothetical protein